LIDLE